MTILASGAQPRHPLLRRIAAVRQAAEECVDISHLTTHARLAILPWTVGLLRRMLAEARQRALTDLHRAYAVVDQTLAAVQTPKQPVNMRHVLSRLLLLQPLRTKTAKILRIVFYLSLAWLLFWVSAAVLFGAGIAASSTNSLLADAFVGLGIFVLCLAIGVAPALPLYWLVLASDRAGSAAVSSAVDSDTSDGWTAQTPASS